MSVSPPRRAKPRKLKLKSVRAAQFIPRSWQESDVVVRGGAALHDGVDDRNADVVGHVESKMKSRIAVECFIL